MFGKLFNFGKGKNGVTHSYSHSEETYRSGNGETTKNI